MRCNPSNQYGAHRPTRGREPVARCLKAATVRPNPPRRGILTVQGLPTGTMAAWRGDRNSRRYAPLSPCWEYLERAGDCWARWLVAATPDAPPRWGTSAS